MSYVVLARKYRPKNFTEMVGQEHVVQALSNALTSQRLHHAYLFTGTRGVGKTTVSRILAKSLNCTGPDGQGGITATPCGVCQACQDIDSGRFVDYTELDAASNRGVDEVQSLLEQAVYKPVQGRFKVFMIDEVHMLTNTAFNAMLKTLEEPPEYLKFVLATTDPQKVPVTVLSRCLQFNLRPMAPETVLEHLSQVLNAEGVSSDTPALRLIARAARGSMRDALSLTDQAIAFGGGALSETTVRQMLGAVDRSHVWSILEALALGDGATVVETVEGLRVNGFSAASTLEEMTAILQRMAVAQMATKSMAADSDDPDVSEVIRLAGLLPADQTQLLYSLCLHGRNELGWAPDEYAALTMVLLRLLAFRPEHNPSIQQTATAVEKKNLISSNPPAKPAFVPVAPSPVVAAIESPAVPEPAPLGHAPDAVPVVSEAAALLSSSDALVHADPEPQPTPVIEPAPAAVQETSAAEDTSLTETVQTLQESVHSGAQPQAVSSPQPMVGNLDRSDADLWFEVVLDLVRAEAVTALVRELALQSQLILRTDEVWQLQVANSALAQSGSRDRLQNALRSSGYQVRLELQTGEVTDSPAKRLAAAAAARQKQAEETMLADPFVQTLLHDFGGKIVPGSIQPL